MVWSDLRPLGSGSPVPYLHTTTNALPLRSFTGMTCREIRSRRSGDCPRPEVVGREFCWGEPDCSVVIDNTLAIERRGGRGGGGAPMLVRPVGRDQRPWNKGLLIGQKKPLEPKHVWSIRVRLEISRSWRDLAIFNLAIDSKLRACDLVKLRLNDICSGAKVRHRATIVQKKTGRPVQFEITEQSRSSVEAWLPMLRTTGSRYLFPSRLHAKAPHIHPPICPAGASLG